MGTRARFDLRLRPETKLERHVAQWLKHRAVDYREAGVFEIAAVARDVMHGGCASGTVGHLIYTRDCVKFYRAHKAEIHSMLRETLESGGITSPAELFGDKWDAKDLFAEDDSNQNLLAWYGFEEACRNVVSRAGCEL
jgi:hypothetical protein